MLFMRFEWDENKNRQNVLKHGIDFEDARKIFRGFTIDTLDDRFDYGEERTISVGLMNGAAIIVVVHTDRQGICRIISARPALKQERKTYDKEVRKAFNA